MNPIELPGDNVKPEPAQLLQQHERWLRTALFARLRSVMEVDDVMQETVTAALENWQQIRDPSAVGPWLYKIAIRQALLYRRKQGRIRKLHEEAEKNVPPKSNAEANPLDWLLAEERNEMVRKALNELPRRDAEILLLKYTEHWSYREIGERLGISTSAVEARLHRARQRMRDRLVAREIVSSGT
ncbi:RNA polymerase sigma factor [Bremerella sp. T1]|uniref:RNA polymerase sigma factor n=1 Tax=Bremerella sp. TYQ1 TaxID=3119568 RepID=UPI001CCE9276|nr:sigma-70 family RNA polymerase sigma factor [Bremerella volcania]UBM33951.1 sigma-70 family RNA polymerase sigma factor [Bremerella volcania]